MRQREYDVMILTETHHDEQLMMTMRTYVLKTRRGKVVVHYSALRRRISQTTGTTHQRSLYCNHERLASGGDPGTSADGGWKDKGRMLMAKVTDPSGRTSIQVAAMYNAYSLDPDDDDLCKDVVTWAQQEGSRKPVMVVGEFNEKHVDSPSLCLAGRQGSLVDPELARSMTTTMEFAAQFKADGLGASRQSGSRTEYSLLNAAALQLAQDAQTVDQGCPTHLANVLVIIYRGVRCHTRKQPTDLTKLLLGAPDIPFPVALVGAAKQAREK